MRQLLLLTLFLAMPAIAEHHRGHAQTRIEESDAHFHSLTRHYFKIERDCDQSNFTDSEKEGWRVIKNYTDGTRNTALAVHAGLYEPGADLQALRRRINSPDFETPLSALRRIKTVLIISSGLTKMRIRAGDECASRYNAIAVNISKAWGFLDEAAWHITDAILEETYQDQEFICSGVNNHCGIINGDN